MIIITINNEELYLNKSISILQAAKILKIEIPSFCFHEKLSIAGNCRMCLVEIKGALKPIASCAVQVTDGMEVITNSVLAKKAREAILEFLLVNHPLDCPICDQGGECDLQDITLFFGNDSGRFYDYNNSRAIQDINLGLLITTSLTRCIHCTRCTRFFEEITNYNKLGMFGRSKDMMIGTFLLDDEIFNNELSGNVIDLCPVGALTSKLYNFKARPWEIQSIETIDILDSLGTNIRIDTRDLEIMRILPRVNQELNQEWISDKTRFSFDGFFVQRIKSPAIIIKSNYVYILNNTLKILEIKNYYIESSWDLIIQIFVEDCILIKKITNMQIIVGNETSLEILSIFRDFHNFFNMHGFFLPTIKNNFNIDLDTNYLFNLMPNQLENIDLFLFVGINLRVENPLLNIRIRKAVLNGAILASIGPSIDNVYGMQKLDNSLLSFYKILQGKHKFCSQILEAKNPIIIVGSDLVIPNITINNFKLFRLSAFNSFLAICELGFINNNYNSQLYYNLGNENIIFNKKKNNYVIYQGSHADVNYKNADLIFPSNIFIEEPQLFMNILGNMVCGNNLSILPSFDFKKQKQPLLYSWEHINYLFFNIPSTLLLIKKPYFIFTLEIILKKLEKLSPKFNLDLKNFMVQYKVLLLLNNNYKINININNNKMFINNIISNFYLTNSITRNSNLMNKLAKQNINE